MAYDVKKLEKQALEAIQKYSLFYINEIVHYLPCSRATFYELDLDKSDAIKEAIEKTKINIKIKLRSDFYKSDASLDKIFLYKLVGNEDELDRINKQKQEHVGKNDGPIQLNIVKSDAPIATDESQLDA